MTAAQPNPSLPLYQGSSLSAGSTVARMSEGEGAPEITGYTDLMAIGTGGTATVYSATQTAIGRRVAVKVVDAVGQQARRFTRELLALSTLSDIPHVVPLYSIESTQDGRPVIVMPLMKDSIAGLVTKNGPCSIEQLVKWTGQLAVAIDEAHRRGIVHRDIKPENVLISAFGDACLADFGIADIADMTVATMTRMQLTPAYAPPEQLTGTNSGSAAGDVYSLAATLYAALAGHPPFGTAADGGVAGLANRIANEPAPRIGGVSEEVEAMLRVGMAKRPADRPPTAGQFASGLVSAAEGGPTSGGRPSTGAGAKAGRTRSTRTRRGATTRTVRMEDEGTARMEGADATTIFGGPGLTSGVLLSEVEARLGGLHTIRVVDPNAASTGLHTVEVRVPPGAHDGQRLRVRTERRGADPAGAEVEVSLLVHVEGQSLFTRKGPNLATTVSVDEGDMARGTQVRVPTLEGSTVIMKVPPETEAGRTFRISGGGTTSAFGRGDLLVTVVAPEGRQRSATASPEMPGSPWWRFLNSLWLVPTLLLTGLFAWAGFLYIGRKANRPEWLKLAAAFALADAVMISGRIALNRVGAPLAGTLLWTVPMLCLWVTAGVVAFRANREWLRWKAARATPSQLQAKGPLVEAAARFR